MPGFIYVIIDFDILRKKQTPLLKIRCRIRMIYNVRYALIQMPTNKEHAYLAPWESWWDNVRRTVHQESYDILLRCAARGVCHRERSERYRLSVLHRIVTSLIYIIPHWIPNKGARYACSVFVVLWINGQRILSIIRIMLIFLSPGSSLRTLCSIVSVNKI